MISNLSEDFEHKAFGTVPAQVSTKAKAVYEELQTMRTACSDRLVSSNPDELDFTADDVAAKFKEGIRWEQLLNQI